MRVDVMQPYGFTQPLSQAGYDETRHHQQLMTDMKSAILEGHLMALCKPRQNIVYLSAELNRLCRIRVSTYSNSRAVRGGICYQWNA
jgi:hypothetical protein